MKLEEGKFYRDGFGDVHGPMKRDDDYPEYPFYVEMTGNVYTETGSVDGTYLDCASPHDLIEEVPVKVVTLHCGETDQWYASETPANTDKLKITFNVIRDDADPSSVRMELINGAAG